MTVDPQDAPRHAGRVVRRVLLRRNIAIDAETAQLVAAAVQAVLQADAPSRPPRRRPRAPATGCEPLSLHDLGRPPAHSPVQSRQGLRGPAPDGALPAAGTTDAEECAACRAAQRQPARRPLSGCPARPIDIRWRCVSP